MSICTIAGHSRGKYQTLHNGQPLPISPSELVAKADALASFSPEMGMGDARTYQVCSEKEAAAVQAAQQRLKSMLRPQRLSELRRDAEHKTEMENKTEYDMRLQPRKDLRAVQFEVTHGTIATSGVCKVCRFTQSATGW